MPGPDCDCDASVLICTRNRAGKLVRTLESLTALRVPDGIAWEVIVVDNASTDNTRGVIDGFVGRLPVRAIHEAKPGLSRARNAALHHARGRYILFTDDDCLVAPDWLATAVRLLAAGPLQLIGGRVELFDPDDLPLATRTTSDRDVVTGFSDLIGFIHGANFIFRRELIDVLGMFDVRLGAGSPTRSAEDLDFVYRARCAGVPVVYEPDLLVQHDHGRRGRSVWYMQLGDYAQGVGGMAVKYLLKGDARPLKMAYWDFRSTLRMLWYNREEWRRVVAKLRTINGVILYYFG